MQVSPAAGIRAVNSQSVKYAEPNKKMSRSFVRPTEIRPPGSTHLRAETKPAVVGHQTLRLCVKERAGALQPKFHLKVFSLKGQSTFLGVTFTASGNVLELFF